MWHESPTRISSFPRRRDANFYREAVTYFSPAAVFFVNDFLAGMVVFPRRVVLEHGVEDD
jgi:hypothetical protein